MHMPSYLYAKIPPRMFYTLTDTQHMYSIRTLIFVQSCYNKTLRSVNKIFFRRATVLQLSYLYATSPPRMFYTLTDTHMYHKYSITRTLISVQSCCNNNKKLKDRNAIIHL